MDNSNQSRESYQDLKTKTTQCTSLLSILIKNCKKKMFKIFKIFKGINLLTRFEETNYAPNVQFSKFPSQELEFDFFEQNLLIQIQGGMVCTRLLIVRCLIDSDLAWSLKQKWGKVVVLIEDTWCFVKFELKGQMWNERLRTDFELKVCFQLKRVAKKILVSATVYINEKGNSNLARLFRMKPYISKGCSFFFFFIQRILSFLKAQRAF